MGDRKIYLSVSISQRNAQQPKAAAPEPTAKTSVDMGTGFAEIEYEPDMIRLSAAEKALRFLSSIHDTATANTPRTPPQPIKQRAPDPIREKFFAMRSLASDRPFARDDSELFYKQAKFMEDFTDDYEGDAKFFMYYPYYQHMGYEQLRTYFTWRAKTRQGEIKKTSPSYIYLYIYELLSGIGVDDPADGLDKLMAVWDRFKEHDPSLSKYFPGWLKDYHIYYELPHSFSSFIYEHNLEDHYALTLIFDADPEKRLSLWNSISTYDVMQSKFLNEGNELLFASCFEAVLDGIGAYFKSIGKNIDDMFIYKVSSRIAWNPFKHALFHNKRNLPERQVTLPGYERYYCKNDRWSANLPIHYSNHRDYAGYILKKTESCLRQATKYKYKLNAELKVRSGYYKELAVTGAELDDVIGKAVEAFFTERNRTVVTVDHRNLARIREEARGTQEALIVPDADAAPDVPGRPTPAAAEAEAAPEVPGCPTPANADDDPWAALKNALTGTERKALSLILNGNGNLRTLADENGLMLEVLIDSINEKATDHIGDNIIDMSEEIAIYDEYKGYITL